MGRKAIELKIPYSQVTEMRAKGIDMETIAQAAGVCVGSLYRRLKNDALLQEALLDGASRSTKTFGTFGSYRSPSRLVAEKSLAAKLDHLLQQGRSYEFRQLWQILRTDSTMLLERLNLLEESGILVIEGGRYKLTQYGKRYYQT